MNKDLGRVGEYARTKVHNKTDSLTTKEGYSTYTQHQEKGERGKEVTDNNIDIDIEGASAAWPTLQPS